MRSELNLLKQYSDQLVADPVTYDPVSILSQVAKECERLKGFLFMVFNKLDKNYNAQNVLNWYRRSTIKLADTLWDASRIGDPLVLQALILVNNFIRHFEEDYPDLLQQKHALSLFEVDEMRKHIASELQIIQVGLMKKNISILLIEQLVKAYSDLFCSIRLPALNYADKKHADVFLPRLMSLSVDERDKDWNLRLRELLIKFNVNHFGIYKLLKTENINDAAFVNQYGEKEAFLLGRDAWLDDIVLIPDIAYNSVFGDLKKMLRNSIGSMMRRMPKRIAERRRFNPNLTMRQLNLLFKYLYRLGLPGYRSKKEAVISFCQNIRSKETEVIAFSSIYKTDTTDMYNTAKTLYKILKKIMDMLKAEFNF